MSHLSFGTLSKHGKVQNLLKDVPGGFPKSDLLGVTVALIHVAAQRFLAANCRGNWPYGCEIRV